MNYGIDTHKLMYHPDRVNPLLSTGDTRPIYVEVSPSRRCNARCKFCAYTGLDRKESQEEEYKFYESYMSNVLPGMLELGVKSVMFCGEGEPLLNNNTGYMARTTTNMGIDTSMTTNGLLICDYMHIIDKLTWIKFSVDAGTPETYSNIKGVSPSNFDNLITDISRACNKAKCNRKNNYGDCTIGVQMLLLPENYKEVETLAAICKRIGADYLVIKPFSPTSYVKTEYDNLEYSEMVKVVQGQIASIDYNIIFRNEAFLDLEEIPKTCAALPLWMNITSSGDVYPCISYFGHEDYIIGNVYNDNLIDIWNSSKRKEVYNRIDTDMKYCRPSCRMSSCNKYLNYLVDNNIKSIEIPGGDMPPHINFI